LITLRPYQSDGIQTIRKYYAEGVKSLLYVLPTGAGKTVLFSAIAESSQRRGKRVLILCHRVELVDQIVAALKEFNVQPDIIAAGYGRRTRMTGRYQQSAAPVAVASVQTLVNRLDDLAPPTLVICDEAHHCAAGNTWSQILRRYTDAKVLGVTATPVRLDGRGLGAHFNKLIVGPSVRTLIEGGYLAKPRVFAPPTVDTSGLHIRAGEFRIGEAEALMDVPSITGDAIAHYKRHADGLPALVFCTSVAHADHVAQKFREAGIIAVALNGSTNADVRRMAVADFRRGAIRVLVSCDLFSEGFDVCGVHAGIMLRPTASEGLHRQQCGRILRTAPGKAHAIILDHVGNTQRFGLPDEDREWALTYDVSKKKTNKTLNARVCPKCWAASPARATICVECKHPFEVKPRQEIEEREGELKEVAPLTPEERAKRRERQFQGRAKSLEQLEAFGRSRGYSPGWALRVMAAREAKRRKKA
jgi:superfamily II DNA or RNA helicase